MITYLRRGLGASQVALLALGLTLTALAQARAQDREGSDTTQAPVQTAEAPAEKTEASAETAETPVAKTAAPVPKTAAPAEQSTALAAESSPPVAESRPPAAEQGSKPSLTFGGGIILWYYQPFLDGAKNNVDTFFARITVDGRHGIWGLHLEPRFRDTVQRPFHQGPVYLQEGYVSASPGPFVVKLGKSYSRLGLFWDNSFYGNVQVYDGLKLAPDYGISVEGSLALSDALSLGATLQYFLVDGRINVSLPARDIVSVPDARRRNAFVGRVDPEFRLGDLGKLRVGVSAQVFEEPTVVRAAIDATLQLGPVSVWGEALEQRGRHVTDFPIAATAATDETPGAPGRASAKNRYYLGGGEVTFGWVTARFNASYARYTEAKTTERFFVPALGIKPVPQILLLAEYVHWRRVQRGEESFVDRSLNVTAHGNF
jgi:hypothetical protein